jgi:hypothetical protein
VLAFVFLDFHLAKSITTSNDNWSRASSQAPAGYQAGYTVLYIATEQDDSFSRALAEAIFQQAGDSNYFSPVLLDSAPTSEQFPLVMVKASADHFFWTPFFAKSTLNIQFAYSNFEVMPNIESSRTVILSNATVQPPIEGLGTTEQVDRSFGLLSISGYRHLVCNLAAKSVLADLEKMVQLD